MKDKSTELTKEVIVLQEVQTIPLAENSKAENKSSYFRKNPKSFVLLVLLLLVVGIAVIIYVKNNSQKLHKQSEQTRINVPTADSATSQQKQSPHPEKQTGTNPTSKQNESESQAIKEPKEIMNHKSDSTKTPK